MRDPYEVLGVPRGASAAAIQSAALSQASTRSITTDANKNDPKSAARFFRGLNSANEIIGDEEQAQAVRSRRDRCRGQAAPSGLSRRRSARAGGPPDGGFRSTFRSSVAPFRGFGSGGFEDILNSMFGGAAARSATRRRRHV